MSRLRKNLIPAASLALAVLWITALAPARGGSFSAAAEPQEATETALFPHGGAPRVMRAECFTLAPSYAAYPCGDCEETKIEIEALLSRVPSMLWESVNALTGETVILLCGGLGPRSEGLPESPRGVFIGGRPNLILIDASSDASRTLAHELCHLIDRALDEAAKADPSHWSEEGWAKLNPEGFAYYGAYCDEEGRPYSECGSASLTAESDPGNAYFISRYSKTFPTEDRAALVEAYLRLGSDSLIMQSPHLEAKLSYYVEAIRYYLGN